MSNRYCDATPAASGAWITRRKLNHEAKVRLICFPYAGGGAAIFRGWTDILPSSIEVCAVQLPGRGARLAEPSLTNLTDIINALAREFDQYFDKPFALFGHSMGAMLSLEFARLLRNERGIEPSHLFISGCRALQLPDPHPATYNLPEKAFIEELRRLNGTPQEVLNNPELINLILPVLRTDFTICQTYKYSDDLPLKYPITVFGGIDDKTKREQLMPWSDHTTSTFTLRMFQGDHFFLHTAELKILEIIAQKLVGAMIESY